MALEENENEGVEDTVIKRNYFICFEIILNKCLCLRRSI